MGGIVTSTRALQQAGLPWRYFNKATNATLSHGELLTPAGLKPSQTTTSYRSGGKELDGDLKLLSSSSNAAVCRALVEEGKDSLSKWDHGHEFSTVLQRYDCAISCATRVTSGGSNRGWEGPVVPDPSFYQFPTYPSISIPSDLTFWGTRAIADTIPTNPSVSLSTAIGELLIEGLPLHSRVFEALTRGGSGGVLRNSADFHLWLEFGVKPLLGDLRATIVATVDLFKTIAQFERDSGRNVRRRWNRPLETVSSQLSTPGRTGKVYDPTGTGLSGFGTVISLASRPLTESLITKRKLWFSGAYTYYLDVSRDYLSQLDHMLARIDRVYGIGITPETLWNVAPWSWFGDWLGNVGDVLHNMNAFSQNGLVLRYGYLMCTTTSEHTAALSNVSDSFGKPMGDITAIHTVTRKDRVRATPYGFGQNPNSFSAAQWAILAALGITKSPRSIRLL